MTEPASSPALPATDTREHTSASLALPTRPSASVFVARQPILDPHGRVFGYELLYRASADAHACIADGDLASARVMTDGLLAFGLDTLTHGQRAFFNVSRRLLLDEAVELLPSDRVVVEIPESMTADPDAIAECRRLRDAGYTLALDGVSPGEGLEPWIPLIEYIKVDVLTTPPARQAALVAHFAPRGITMVAERIEMHDAYSAAHEAGYRLFQGFFFSRPVTLGTRDIPGRRLGYLRLLQALASPTLTLDELETLVEHDVSLCYRVLRTVNSAAFGLRMEVRSVRQALMLLGRDIIRKWAGVWALAGLAEGKSQELVTMALIRAECCAALARTLWDADTADELFLVGVLSLLDAMLERPMFDIVSTLPLSGDAEAALRGDPGPWRQVLDCVVAYERAEWDTCEALATRLGVDAADLPAAYAGALRWSRELSR